MNIPKLYGGAFKSLYMTQKTMLPNNDRYSEYEDTTMDRIIKRLHSHTHAEQSDTKDLCNSIKDIQARNYLHIQKIESFINQHDV